MRVVFWLVGHLLLLCKIKILVEHQCLWFLHSWSRIEAWKPEIIKIWVILLTVGSVLAAFTPTVFPIYFRWEAPRVVQPWWFATAFTPRYSNTWRWTQPNSLLAASTSHYGSQSQEPAQVDITPEPPTLLPGHHTTLAVLDLVWMLFLFFSFLSLLLFYLFIFTSQQSFTHLKHTCTLTILDGFLEFCSTLVQISKVNHWPNNLFSIPY